MATSAREELRARIDKIEGAYEFFLAYAAQGLREELAGSRVTGQFRTHMDAMATAVQGLGDLVARLVREEDGLPGASELRAFGEVVASDEARAAAVIQLVRAQPFATSQLVDNLNASAHLRTLLTDLFILDEMLSLGVDLSPEARAPEPA